MVKKPILIIQLRPEDPTSNSEFQAILRASRLDESEVIRYRAEIQGLPPIDFADYSAIIVGGSPYDVSTPEAEKSDSQKKVESDFYQLFASLVKEDFPFLGACSGNGLLGSYCGVPVTKKYGEPVSGVDLYLTEEARHDPVLEGVSPQFRALVGHKEACERVPENAVLLAYSDTCPVEMFRVGENIYATQFHPEADPAEFELRINVYKNYGYFKPEDAQDLIDAVKKEVITEPQKILKNFVDKYYRHIL